MPGFFFGQKDYAMTNQFSRQLMQDIIATQVILFRINAQQTKVNVYGQSKKKAFFEGVDLYASIYHDPDEAQYRADTIEYNYAQVTTIKFQKQLLEQNNVYPAVGDIIYRQDSDDFMQIGQVYENQFIASRPDLSFSVVCISHEVSRSKISTIAPLKKAIASQRRKGTFNSNGQ